MALGSGIQKKPIPDPGSRGQKGTGSRIRIRNRNSDLDHAATHFFLNRPVTSAADPDPHWFGFPGSESVLALLGMRFRIQKIRTWPKFTNKPDFQLFRKTFSTYKDMFYDLYLHKVYFHVKIQLLRDGKVWPRCGFVRSQTNPHWLGFLDPAPHWC